MDPVEQTSCEEWSSLSGFYTAEEADFVSQLLYGNFNLEIPSALWPGHESTIVSVTGINSSSHFPENADNNSNAEFLSFLQGSSFIADTTSNIFPTTDNIGYISMGDAKFSPYSVQGNGSQQINDNSTDEEFALEEVIGDKNFQAHKECEVLVSEAVEEDITNNMEKSGKRSRSSMEVEYHKSCFSF